MCWPSSAEYCGNAMGLDLDEDLTLARWLGEGGIDFLHLAVWHFSKPSKKRPEEHVLPMFKAAVPEVPLETL